MSDGMPDLIDMDVDGAPNGSGGATCHRNLPQEQQEKSTAQMPPDACGGTKCGNDVPCAPNPLLFTDIEKNTIKLLNQMASTLQPNQRSGDAVIRRLLKRKGLWSEWTQACQDQHLPSLQAINTLLASYVEDALDDMDRSMLGENKTDGDNQDDDESSPEDEEEEDGSGQEEEDESNSQEDGSGQEDEDESNSEEDESGQEDEESNSEDEEAEDGSDNDEEEDDAFTREELKRARAILAKTGARLKQRLTTEDDDEEDDDEDDDAPTSTYRVVCGDPYFKMGVLLTWGLLLARALYF